MHEPDVTLTDYGLTLLCAIFAWKLRGRGAAWPIFFASIALGALAGGTVHGFFPDSSTWANQILWTVTLLAIGVTTASGWVLTGLLISGDKRIRPWVIFATLTFLIYTSIVLFYSRGFEVVILNYMPAMIAFFCASLFRRERWISLGLAISFLAAYVQMAQVAIHAQYFNHNSTYHLVQAFGLAAVYAGAKGFPRGTK